MPKKIINNILIETQTFYIQNQSNQLTNEYVFAYSINIINNGTSTIQLLNRHWIINDGNGETREVFGEGVVGQQPILESGESFNYTSGCCLKSEVGKMNGHYEFLNFDTKKTFKALIPELILETPFILN
jgi:ApaG protein